MRLPLPQPGPGGFGVQGANAINALMNNIFKSNMQQKFLPQQMQEMVRQKQLQNNALQQKMPFVQPMAQAELTKNQLSNKILQFKADNPSIGVGTAEAQNLALANFYNQHGHPEKANQLFELTKANINQKNALSNYRAIQAKLAPIRTKAMAQRVYQNLSKTPWGQQVIAKNPNLLASLETMLQQASAQATTNPLDSSGPSQTMGQEQVSSQGPQQGGVASQQSSGDIISGSSGSAQSTPLNADQLSDDMFNRRSQLIRSSVKQSLDPMTNKRLEAGLALDSLLNTQAVQDAFNTLKQYKGKFGDEYLKVAQGWANNDPRMQKLVSARNQLGSIIAGSLKQLEGFPSTDQSVNMAKNFFMAASNRINQDPAQAAEDIKQGLALIDAEKESLLKQTGYKRRDFQRYPSDRVTMISPDGKHVTIPRFQIQDAMNKYKFRFPK